MRTYGQYCPVARTSELFAERWTPIIIRNLLGGAATFGELRDGAPGIPKALLASRLKGLAAAGVLTRNQRGAHEVTYELTRAGRDLKAICDAMGSWGMRWLEVEPEHVEPGYVLWATAKLVDTSKLPQEQVTIQFALSDAAPDRYWLLCHRPHAEVCTRYPGTTEDLIVHTDTEALARLHLRQTSFAQLQRQGRLRVDGPTSLARALPTWLRPSPYAVQ